MTSPVAASPTDANPPQASSFLLGCRTITAHQYPLVMGIINVTPDSFSDGGLHVEPDEAAACAERMVTEGADILDIGAESTRPGSVDIPAEQQIDRLRPVLERVRKQLPDIPISVDTRSAAVAEMALAHGVQIINDISAMRDDPRMVDVVARSKASVVLMHMHGNPRTMQANGGPVYADVLGDIISFLRERMQVAIDGGIDPQRIILDPGIGFGKRIEDNLLIMNSVTSLCDMGYPVLIGASRKRFIGETLQRADPKDRMIGSVACAIIAAQQGAAMVRVHDVKPTVEALRMWRAIARS